MANSFFRGCETTICKSNEYIENGRFSPEDEDIPGREITVSMCIEFEVKRV